MRVGDRPRKSDPRLARYTDTGDLCLIADCTIERYIGSLRNGAGGTTTTQEEAPT
jgi:hypothetical protein